MSGPTHNNDRSQLCYGNIQHGNTQHIVVNNTTNVYYTSPWPPQPPCYYPIVNNVYNGSPWSSPIPWYYPNIVPQPLSQGQMQWPSPAHLSSWENGSRIRRAAPTRVHRRPAAQSNAKEKDVEKQIRLYAALLKVLNVEMSDDHKAAMRKATTRQEARRAYESVLIQARHGGNLEQIRGSSMEVSSAQASPTPTQGNDNSTPLAQFTPQRTEETTSASSVSRSGSY